MRGYSERFGQIVCVSYDAKSGRFCETVLGGIFPNVRAEKVSATITNFRPRQKKQGFAASGQQMKQKAK
jgi:hypothetical protein